jgi:hypothetical protein
MKFKSDEERVAWDGYAKTALIELMAPAPKSSRKDQSQAFLASWYGSGPIPKPKSLEKQAAEIADGLLKLRRAREN